MPYYCTVPRCTSMAGKARDVSFHQFPRDLALAEHWNLVLRRGKPYTKYSKVCSRHFTSADYTCTTVGKNKGHWRTLRKDAVPSQNLPDEAYVPRPPALRSDTDSLPDQQMQQQLARAVYMQTMLAVHLASSAAAGSVPATDDASDISDEEDSQESSKDQNEPIAQNCTVSTEEPQGWHATEVVRDSYGNLHPVVTRTGWYHRDTITDSNPSIRPPKRPLATPTKPTRTAFKCEDCSKCFKDPDVFLLHTRWHRNRGWPNAEGGGDILRKLKPDVGECKDALAEFDPLRFGQQILLAMKSNLEDHLKGIATGGLGQNGDDQVSLPAANGLSDESGNSDPLVERGENSGG